MERRLTLTVATTLAAIFTGGAGAMPDIVAVAPSGPTVPARLLRISVTFATPQVGGLASPAALLRADGTIIIDALVDQQLWSPDRRTVTLLLDPGRVKSGLVARSKAGPVLRPGELVALRISDQIVHRWTVDGGGCVVPDPASWNLATPRSGSREPVQLGFPGPIDALSRERIAVADMEGNRIGGSATLADGERRWRFVPALPWPRGTLQIIVHPRMENACGDEPGEPFEHPAGQGLGSHRAALNRAFTIR